MPTSLDVSMAGTWAMAATGGPQWTDSFAATTAPTGRWSYADGTGDQQVKQNYRANFSVTAGSTLSVDLKGGGGELDQIRFALAFSRIRWVHVEITTPGTGVSLQVGPLGLTNAWQGWFSAVTSGFYEIVPHLVTKTDPFGVWPAVGASTKILGIKNPGAATVAGTLIVSGY